VLAGCIGMLIVLVAVNGRLSFSGRRLSFVQEEETGGQFCILRVARIPGHLS
jgi:hypothetical protein